MAASVSATVTQSVSMSGAPFSSIATTIVGSSSCIVEKTYTAGLSEDTGAVFTAGDLQLLYLLSDSSNGMVTFTGTSGTDTVALVAGVAQIFNLVASPASDPTVVATGQVQIFFENTGAVTTDLHVRLITLS